MKRIKMKTIDSSYLKLFPQTTNKTNLSPIIIQR